MQEIALTKLDQDVNMAIVDRQRQVKELTQKLLHLASIKHDLTTKLNFINTKQTDSNTILLDQIEQISKELYSLKQTVHAKLSDFQ